MWTGIEGVIVVGMIAVVVIYALDYAVFGRIANVVSISRLTKGESAQDLSYQPLRWWRVGGALLGGLAVAASRAADQPLQNILYLLVALLVVIMGGFTYAEATSRQ